MLTEPGQRQAGLVTVVRRTLLEECGVARGEGLLLAVSGGPDSMAMLGVMAHLAPELGLRLTACGVDHGLRAEASAELDLVERCAAEWGIPFERRRVQVSGRANVQAAARDARYAALDACAAQWGSNYIVTAHHREDRAETVLLRLLRGAGPGGLCVLPPRLGNRLRPLIRASKSQIWAYVEHRRIPFVSDPSNVNSRFLRVRVRQELLPLMQELSPGIVDHLNNLADELNEEPLPPIVDENGAEIQLNRSQRTQLRHALRTRQKRAVIWLSEGRAITIDAETNLPRLVPASVATQNSTSRATKTPKSH